MSQSAEGHDAGAAARRREERLAQALRDNLKRRKDQARGRVVREPAAEPGTRDVPQGRPAEPPEGTSG